MDKAQTDVPEIENGNDDPANGNVKVTRDEWVSAARDVLVSEGAAQVKVLALSQRLNVSRSSFYWYFKNRQDLLSLLLDEWEERNTRTIIAHCAMPATDIGDAVCNFFRCFIDPGLFDSGLDFAIREWARRDQTVRARIDAADRARLSAISAMFGRNGYPDGEAEARARIIYFMQLGYHALDVRETMETRLSLLENYLLGFTGVAPRPESIEQFVAFARRKNRG